MRGHANFDMNVRPEDGPFIGPCCDALESSRDARQIATLPVQMS